jgi:hypothetical protein
MNYHVVEKRAIWTARVLLWGEILAIAAFLLFRLYVEVNLPPVIPPKFTETGGVPTDRTDVTLPLKRGDFSFYRYVPSQPEFTTHPKAVIIFGSGDGGFDGWEDRVCKSLQADGYEVLGYDCNSYAKTDYDMATLQADMAQMARSSLGQYGDHPPPLIFGGWSMGAEQAVAAAGGPDRPADLTGLLLISPGSRGRYGLRESDRWDVSPTGEGTYSLKDFASKLDGLRVVQWDGNLDILDSKAWLDSLTAIHKTYGYPYGLHDYDGASDDFLALLKKSVSWILSPDQPSDPQVNPPAQSKE